jgi:hypothetical protein
MCYVMLGIGSEVMVAGYVVQVSGGLLVALNSCGVGADMVVSS